MKDNVLLRTENMSRKYVISDRRETEIEVLKDINLEIREQEFISIMGKSGSGKTTLLKLLGLIDRPTSGKLYFKGVDSEELRGDRLARIRRQEMGFVYQDYYLLDSLSVFENIMLPMILDHKDDKICKEEAEKLAVSFQIQNLLGKYPYELSGGEKRRVAIAGIIALSPKILVLDEPTAGLDPHGEREMLKLFQKIYETGTSIVLVTHNMDIVLQYAQDVVVLSKGKIVKEAKPLELFQQLDFLKKVAIESPYIFKVAMELIDNGLPLNLENIKDIETLAKEIRRVKA